MPNNSNCVLGHQSWPQLSASSNNRGSTNNQTRNEDSDRSNKNNNNDFQQSRRRRRGRYDQSCEQRCAGCSTTATKKKNSTKRSTKVKYQFIECDISKENRKLLNGIECFGTVIEDSEKHKVVQKFSFCAARRITCDLVIGDSQPNLTLGKASI
ncbi:unnamed protein product [Macrosiphum euphorbiae]|uniref:Uncharacterized protein n=1 Tax=Macrosiphum euphorbiae TaxID=13131 RepID=A0AAV0Y126_9HEMI|nr:unnamed protein product [Macrosiphum euphorbiae]